MRPLLHPALTRVWRDPTTIQIGLDPTRAIVLGGLSAPETAVLRSINGRCDDTMLRAIARDAGGDESAVDRLLDTLNAAGVVVDRDHADTDGADTDGSPGDELAADQACLGLQTGHADGGVAALKARRDHWVEVRSSGRVGSDVARLLAATGVGRTTVEDMSAEPTNPSLIVLAPPPGTITVNANTSLSAGVPHLLARVVDVTGIVGPLVIPGRSSCLRCHDLHRTDRDPAWPKVVAQAQHAPPKIAACDVTLAAHVAAFTAQQALAYLDGFTPTTVDGTVEISLPNGLPRRRSWRSHPACGCSWV